MNFYYSDKAFQKPIFPLIYETLKHISINGTTVILEKECVCLKQWDKMFGLSEWSSVWGCISFWGTGELKNAQEAQLWTS